MKKMINTSIAYMILGLVFGVFYREFTKFHGFVGTTQLSVLHTHALVLGMFFFLIVALFFSRFNLAKEPKFKKFYFFYNLGLILNLVMMVVRGVTQVLGTNLASGPNAAISGIAGLTHIILTIGLFYFYAVLRQFAKK